VAATTFGNLAPGSIPESAIEAEADPLERLRMRYGHHPAHATVAMRQAHPAIERAWFQPGKGVGILELWFRPGTTAAEQSAAARAAYQVLPAWYPDVRSWDVRARPGREMPDPRRGHLGPRRDELDLLARARAKRLRAGELCR
jgi:hypothetical protein